MNNKDINYYKNLPWTRIFKQNEDGTFFAEIKELKGCMTEGDNIIEANKMLEDALISWLETALEHNHKILEPNEDNLEDYSGKFNVRVPKSIHKKLVEKASKEGVSLNSIINTILVSGLAC
jgi:antitoxin HicB